MNADENADAAVGPRQSGPSGRAVLAGVLLFLAAAAPGAKPAKPAKAPKIEPIADNVRDWWVMNGGRTLVAWKTDSFYSCPAAAGYLKRFCEGEGVRGPRKLDEKTIGYEAGGKGYALLDVAAGKAATAVTGPGQYEALCVEPGRGWFILMRTEPASGGCALFRVRPATGKAERVYDLKGTPAVGFVHVSDDGRTLIVAARTCLPAGRSGEPATMVQHTVDLQTRKADTKKLPRGSAAQPPRPLKTYELKKASRKVFEKDGRMWFQLGRQRMNLFQDAGREWSIPDLPDAPTCLIIPRVVDSNHDGKISREGGDRIEIWAMDLDEGRQIRLADASKENILARPGDRGRPAAAGSVRGAQALGTQGRADNTRAWTPDGRYFLYNQLPVGVDESQWRGDLIVFRKAGAKLMRFQPGENTNYVSYHAQAGPDRLLISYMLFARGLRTVKKSHFALLELGAGASLELVGHGFPGAPDGQIAGTVLLYAVQDFKTKTSRLFRCPLAPPRAIGKERT